MIAHAAWAPGLEDARVIDLFAGSGALGLEALSRGAGFCLFVENAHAACGAIRKNLATFGVSGVARLHKRSAVELGSRPDSLAAPFDIAFLDPPYHKGLVAPCLAALVAGDWLAPGALIVVETASDEAPDFDRFERVSERKSGAAKFWFLTGP